VRRDTSPSSAIDDDLRRHGDLRLATSRRAT
jgi:hypothetical protein